jgi:hypothetical protein
MKLKVSLAIGVLAVALAALVAVVVPSAQAKTGGSYTTSYDANAVPSAATTPSSDVPNAPATGNITITGFKKVGGVINAVGTFTGTIAGVNGGQQLTDVAFTAPVTNVDGHSLTGNAATALAAADPSCQILDLTLGPLHLDLLGLVVDLNQVHLTITAQSGSGNLLGNLLCSVAHLLDNTGGGSSGLSGLLQQLTSLLNQILAQL